MNTNQISANGNGNHDTNGFSLRKLLPFRRVTQAKDPAPAPASYRHQDRVAYEPEGNYSHGKPVGGETQFGINGKIPAPAFGMPQPTIAGYLLHARVAAFAGETLESVRAHGARLFDARYAQLKAQFEGRIAAAHRLIHPLSAEANTIRSEADAVPAVVKDPHDRYTLPTDWRLLAIVLILGLWGFVTWSEWINAASRQVYELQSWTKAMQATAPWLAVGLVVECIIISSVGAASCFWRKVWRGVSLASILFYAIFYAFRWGATADNSVAAALDAALNGNSAAHSKLLLDQCLYFGQLLFGLICSAALLEAILNLMVGRDVVVPNPDRVVLHARAEALTERINQEDAPLCKAAGHLAEYQACREAFIDFGVRAYLSVAAEKQIFDQERALIARERDVLERQRRALLN